MRSGHNISLFWFGFLLLFACWIFFIWFFCHLHLLLSEPFAYVLCSLVCIGVLEYFSCQFLVTEILYNENVKVGVCVYVLLTNWHEHLQIFKLSSYSVLVWEGKKAKPPFETQLHFQQKRKVGVIKLLNKSNLHCLLVRMRFFFSSRAIGTSFLFIHTVVISNNKKPLLRNNCRLEAEALQNRGIKANTAVWFSQGPSILCVFIFKHFDEEVRASVGSSETRRDTTVSPWSLLDAAGLVQNSIPACLVPRWWTLAVSKELLNFLS